MSRCPGQDVAVPLGTVTSAQQVIAIVYAGLWSQDVRVQHLCPL